MAGTAPHDGPTGATSPRGERARLLATIERERTAAAAVEIERRRLDAILNQMPAMVVVFDADGRITQANDQYLNVIGLTAEQIVGRDYHDFPVLVVDEAGEPIPRPRWPSTRALHDEQVDTELGIAGPAGTRWVHVSAGPIRGDGGAIEGAILFMRDLTAEREAAAALRESETRRRALLDAIPDSLYVVDDNGIVLERRAPDDGRIRLHAVYVGRSLVDLLGEDLGRPLMERITLAHATGRPQQLEYESTGPAGPLNREARIVAMGTNQALLLIRDIGERKRVEREREQLMRTVEQDRRRLDAILRQVPNTLIVFDTEGRIVVANDALSSNLNVSKDGVVGQRSHDLGSRFLMPDGRELSQEELPSSQALRGEEFDGELQVRRADGWLGWLHVSAAPVRDELGTIAGAILATHDITAERQALQALRASEARYRALLEATPDSIYVCARDATILDFKPPRDGRAMLDVDDIVGRRVGEIWGPEIEATVLELAQATLDTGEPHTLEYQIPTPDGLAYREARVVPYGEDRILALVRDVDARRRGEEEREQLVAALETERRRLDAILRQMPNSLIVLDSDGRIVEANDAMVRATGEPKQALLGRKASDLSLCYFDPDGNPIGAEELPSQLALQGEDAQRVMRVEKDGGRTAWIHASSAPIRDEHGNVVSAVVTALDVTAEREATTALRESEATNRALLHAMPDSLYRLDREGTILSWKPATGLRQPAHLPKDFTGLPIADLVTTDVGRQYHDAIHHVLETGEARVLEYEMHVPDMIGYREARIVRLGPAEALALVRDIGDRKRAELALQTLNQELELRVRERTAELQAANAELEAFSYSVSHDLKAPLRGIDGYGRLLWEDYRDRLDDEGQFLLENVRQATVQMHQLIDDLLAYSRLERRAIDDNAIEILPIVEGLLDERADEILARGVEMVVQVPAVTVRADRDGFAQAFRNLLDNALRFTAASPTPRIEIGNVVADDRCTLWVRDNGIGFDMRYHDRIFEIFQRLHRQEEYPGTGIGLALVRKAMQRMGGRVWAESSPGAGATFYLEVPR